MDQITVYGAPWCPGCRRSKPFLTHEDERGRRLKAHLAA